MTDDLVKLIALLRKLDAAATPGPWEADGRHVVTSNELGWITGHVADAGEQDVDLIVVVRNHLTRLLDAAESARVTALEEAAVFADLWGYGWVAAEIRDAKTDPWHLPKEEVARREMQRPT